jgi:hypothetical protein
MKGWRRVLPISLSSKHPEVAVLEEALKGVPERERSITVVRWAVAYLTGQLAAPQADEIAESVAVFGMTPEEIDACLDAF